MYKLNPFDIESHEGISISDLVRGHKPSKTEADWNAWRSEDIDVRKLSVDAYQREVRPYRVNAIVNDVKENGWNPLRAGIISISRREDGSYFIIDGQHRVTAIIILNGLAPFVQRVAMYYGLTPEQEAFMFSETQARKARLAVLPGEVHNARLHGDKSTPESIAAQAIEDIVQSNGFHINPKTASKGSQNIRAVESLQFVYERYGGDVLDSTLGLLRATWGDEAKTVSPVIRGFALFVAIFPDANYQSLIKRLRKSQADFWIEDARRWGQANKVSIPMEQIYRYIHFEYNLIPRINALGDAAKALAEHKSDINKISLAKANKVRLSKSNRSKK